MRQPSDYGYRVNYNLLRLRIGRGFFWLKAAGDFVHTRIGTNIWKPAVNEYANPLRRGR